MDVDILHSILSWFSEAMSRSILKQRMSAQAWRLAAVLPCTFWISNRWLPRANIRQRNCDARVVTKVFALKTSATDLTPSQPLGWEANLVQLASHRKQMIYWSVAYSSKGFSESESGSAGLYIVCST
jgi:hypothetical protein